MSDSMTVTHLGADRFAVEIRGHTVMVDQPVDVGGEDTAPTPTELFIASLATCVAFYARRFLARHDIPADGLSVTTGYTTGGTRNRVTDIGIRITPPPGLPIERRDALLAVASHCTVHNTLHEPPAVQITLVSEELG
ncbi:MAG: OsmC family protein [Actinomycetota bacterium]|nr:OsmC family protein [Actinomycetota bacterium]